MGRERLKLVSNCRKWSPTPLPTSLRLRKSGSSTSCRAAVAYGLIPCGWEATLWTTTCTGIPTSTTEAWRTGGHYSTACVRQSCLPSTFHASGRGWWRCFPARSKPCVQHLGTIKNGIEIETWSYVRLALTCKLQVTPHVGLGMDFEVARTPSSLGWFAARFACVLLVVLVCYWIVCFQLGFLPGRCSFGSPLFHPTCNGYPKRATSTKR